MLLLRTTTVGCFPWPLIHHYIYYCHTCFIIIAYLTGRFLPILLKQKSCSEHPFLLLHYNWPTSTASFFFLFSYFFSCEIKILRAIPAYPKVSRRNRSFLYSSQRSVKLIMTFSIHTPQGSGFSSQEKSVSVRTFGPTRSFLILLKAVFTGTLSSDFTFLLPSSLFLRCLSDIGPWPSMQQARSSFVSAASTRGSEAYILSPDCLPFGGNSPPGQFIILFWYVLLMIL